MRSGFLAMFILHFLRCSSSTSCGVHPSLLAVFHFLRCSSSTAYGVYPPPLEHYHISLTALPVDCPGILGLAPSCSTCRRHHTTAYNTVNPTSPWLLSLLFPFAILFGTGPPILACPAPPFFTSTRPTDAEERTFRASLLSDWVMGA